MWIIYRYIDLYTDIYMVIPHIYCHYLQLSDYYYIEISAYYIWITIYTYTIYTDLFPFLSQYKCRNQKEPYKCE